MGVHFDGRPERAIDMTVLIDVEPMELLEILIDKERLRQQLAMREAEGRRHQPEQGSTVAHESPQR
jgi:hypothetical protein